MATAKEQRDIVRKLQKKFEHRPPMSMRELQAKMATRAPVRGGVWISQDVFSAPQQSNLPELLSLAIEDMAAPGVDIPIRDSIKLVSVPFEWVGRRDESTASTQTQSDWSDEELYRKLCAETDNDLTILYAHGGAFYVGSPTYSRPSTTKLAKLTKARVASVAYRLAPQNPFPAALLDLLTAWLSLVYPTHGARHAAVSPNSVVFAGDSAGGNLCLSAIQAILHIRSMKGENQVLFDGKEVQIPLPAGVAILSPSADLSLNLPSWLRNAHIDYLHDLTPVLNPDQLTDDVWPTHPPRGDPYCHPSAWLHPLVCPAIAENWRGSPPLWIAIGEERCADGAKVVATQAARHNVRVLFSEYLGLPHIFPILLNKLPQSQQCFQEWATACLDFWRKAPIRSSGTAIHMPGDRRQAIDIDCVSTLSVDEARRLIADSASRRKPWTGSPAKL